MQQQHMGQTPPITETGLINGVPSLKDWTEEDLVDIGRKYREIMISVDSVRFERNFKAAHDELLKAIDLCPFQPEAYYKRALLYFQTSNQKEMLRAVTITKYVCRGHPFWTLLCDGYIEEVAQNFDRSKNLYLSAFKIEKETVLEYYQTFYSISRNMAETMYSLFDIFTPFFSIFNAGCVMMDLDLYTESIKEFENAIISLELACSVQNFYFPEHRDRILSIGRALCYNNIGCCYINDETETALKYLDKAVDNCSNYILVYSNRISTNTRADNFEKVVEDTETVLKFVKNPDTYENMEIERIAAIEKITRGDTKYSYSNFKKEAADLQKKYPKNYSIYITQACSASSLESAIDILDDGIENIDGSAVEYQYKLLTLIEFRSQLLIALGRTVESNEDSDFVNMAYKSDYLLRIE